MRGHNIAHLGLCTVIGLSMLFTVGCSNTRQAAKAPEATQSEKQLQEKKQLADSKKLELATLEQKLKQTIAKRTQAQKQIPIVLGQSDTAFKLAKQYKTNAGNTKNPMSKKDLLAKSEKAQKLADQKALEMLTLRKVLYNEHPQILSLQKQVDAASKKKAAAEKVAKIEADRVHKLKLAGRVPSKDKAQSM